MDIKRVEPSFGMAIYKTQKAKMFINKLDIRDAFSITVMQIHNRICPVNILLSVLEKGGKQKLQATVGDKIYIQNIFHGPVSTVRRATKYAKTLHEKLLAEGYSPELKKLIKKPKNGKRKTYKI